MKNCDLSKNFIELSQDLICIAGFDGFFKYVNPAWAKLIGYTEKELLSKPFLDFIHSDDHSKSKSAVTDLSNGKALQNFENRYLCKDGTIKYIQWTATPKVDEKFMYCVGRDFTAQKLAEQEIANEKMIADKYLKIIGSIILNLNQEGEIALLNEKGHEVLGYQDGELIGKNWFQTCLPKHNSVALKSYFDELMDGKVEGQETHENEVVRKDGQNRIIKWYNTLVKDEHGKITGILSSGEDITERKQAEIKLAETKQFYESIIKGVQDGIWVTNEKDVIIFANEAMGKIAGIPPEKIQGNNILKDFPEETTGEIISFYKEAKREKRPVWYEIKVKTPSDRDTWQNGWLIPKYEDGVFKGIICTIRDITDRKQSEKALKLSEEKYKTLIETASDAIYLMSEDGRIIDTNQCACNMLGRSKDEIIGSMIDSVDPSYPLDEFLKFWQNVPFNEQYIFETTHLKKDGTLIPIEISGEKYKLNEEVFYYGIARDISERKRAENRLIESEEKYRTYVEDATLGIFIADGKGNYVDVNPGVCKLLDYSQDELLKLSIRDISNLKDDVENFKQLKKEGKLSYETELKKKDGTIVYVRLDAVSLPNNRFIAFCLDITKRKLVEEAQKESEERFRELVNTINSGVAIYKVLNDGKSGSDYIIQEFNAFSLEYEQLEKQNVIGRSLKDIRPNIDDYGLIETFQKVWKTGKSAFFPAKVYVDEKYANYYENRVFRLPSGEIVAIYDDVSEKENALIEIKESKDRFDLAMNASKDGIFDWDLITNEIYYSPGWKSMLGYEYDEIPNDFFIWETNTEPEDAKRSWAMQQEVITKKRDRFEMEFKMKHKDGHWVDILSRADAVFDKNGKAVRMVGTHVDISERKKLEKTKDILVAISNEILTTNDLKEFFHRIFIELREIIETNNFYIALYDEQSEMISTPYIADQLDTSITDFPAKKTMTGHVIKTKKSMLINQADFYELDKSGVVDLVGPSSDVWIGVPLFSGEKVIGAIVIQNYKGEKKLSMEDLRVLEYVVPQISLAIERKKVVEDLKLALEKAKESDRLKSAFLANMSHEIRTPMNGILGFTELLKEPGLSGEEQQKYISIIESSGDRILNTIHDIIDISKIEAGQVELSYSTINLNNQLDELFDFFLPEAKKKNIQLSVIKSFTDPYASIKTDKDKLNSILTNLIKNAIKFTDSGKIEFGYLVNEKAQQADLQFYVKDTGVGISKEKQKAVFDRFVQADVESTRLYEGSGLGLAISKAYVEMLKGEIWLKSEVGVGSQFYFAHPYHVKKNQLKNISDSGKPKNAKKNLKILIAEDEEFAVDLLTVLLKDYCKDILVAKTGIEAVELCRNNPDLDLILMDIRLPEINGYEATKRIRKFNKGVFILAQTAFALAGDEQKSLAAGCNDYITKPIKKERLFEILSRNF